jgi:hypothetical protein
MRGFPSRLGGPGQRLIVDGQQDHYPQSAAPRVGFTSFIRRSGRRR